VTDPRHDRWGRYILPDPTTGQEHPWTRATTLASSIADTWGLTAWKMRMVAKGIASRPDLLALAAATSVEDKKKLDGIASDALEAAGGSTGANLGIALHSFTEQFDRGEAPEIPELWQADLDAYALALEAAGIEVFADWIERVVICEQFAVAGTFDRIVRVDGAFHVADVKTGADLSYGWGEIAVQLALYAHAEWMWEAGVGYGPMPPLSHDRALVIHLPARKARCDLYWVDIAAGWEAGQMCAGVRAWRTRKDLARPFDNPVSLLEGLEEAKELSAGTAGEAAGVRSAPPQPSGVPAESSPADDGDAPAPRAGTEGEDAPRVGDALTGSASSPAGEQEVLLG
jgi:hypothetical protein